MQAEISYINGCCGLKLSAEEIITMLGKMSFAATTSRSSPHLIDVHIPPTRADVLHQCDIMEDVAVAYGFNNLPRSFPGKSGTIAQPLMINKLSDIVRIETAMAGWSEVMPLILCSHDENFAWLNRIDDGTTAVKLANPKTAEYQIVRTSLLPGLLKTIKENKHHSVPIKVFEVSDIALKDLSLERKSRNERHFAAAFCGKTSGFEVVHGLLDRIMCMLKSAFVTHEEGLEGTEVDGYWIEEADGIYDFHFTHCSHSLFTDQFSSTRKPESETVADVGMGRSNILPRPRGNDTRSVEWSTKQDWDLWHLASDCAS